MLDIGKLMRDPLALIELCSFISMLDIGKLILKISPRMWTACFISMLDIGKLIRHKPVITRRFVLAQCWI